MTGTRSQAPHQVVRRLFGPQPEPLVGAAGAVDEQWCRALRVTRRYAAGRRPFGEHLNSAGNDGRQPDRDAGFQHVDEGVARRGIGVRPHEAADVIREASAREFGNGALIGDSMRVRPLPWSPELGGRGSELQGEADREELVQTCPFMVIIESVGRQVCADIATVGESLAEGAQQQVVLVPVRHGEVGRKVRGLALGDVVARAPIREHGHDHLGHVPKIRYVPRQIDPAGHVVGRCDALDLLVPTKPVPNVLEAEAQQQIAENSPLDIALEPVQFVSLGQPLRDPVHGGLLALLGRRSGRGAIRRQKFAGAPPVAVAEHVEDGRKDCGDFESLKCHRQHLVVVAAPDLVHHVW